MALRSSARFLAGLALCAALASGCPDSQQQSCPSGTSSVGGLQLDFAQVDAGDFCVVSLADGGPTDSGISQLPSVQGTFCASPADAGLIYLAVAGQQTRQAPIDSAGNFVFTSSTLQTTDTQCGCAVDIAESVSGNLTARAGGAATFEADGGFPQVGGMTAALVDLTTYSDAGPPALPSGQPPPDAGCLCALPCALRYTMTGKPQQ